VEDFDEVSRTIWPERHGRVERVELGRAALGRG